MPWWWGCQLSGGKRYEGVRFNVFSITKGRVGVKFPGKKRYVTLEWPLILYLKSINKYIIECLFNCLKKHSLKNIIIIE